MKREIQKMIWRVIESQEQFGLVACNTEVSRDPDVCIAVNQTLNCMVEEEARVGTNLVLE
ncbi:hypothetical protein CBL_21136 [Carabus blaptoides fortunei]